MPMISLNARFSKLDADAVLFPVLEFSAKEIAEHITLIESEIFMKIQPEEFIMKLWGNPKVYSLNTICKNLISSVELFNQVHFLWID